MHWHKRSVKTHKVTLTYYVAGKGRPVLFLHGVGVIAMTYKRILDILAQDHTVIAPDLPGFGDSTVPKEIWDMRDYAQAINSILEYEHLQDVVVIGHSFGGRIALLLAALSGRLTKAIVLNASGTRPQESKLILAYRFFFAKSNYLPWTADHIKIMSVIARDFFSNVIRQILYLPHLFTIVFNCLYRDYPEIKNITIPILLVRSIHDTLVQPAEIEILKQLIPHIEVKEIEGDHDTLLFYPTIMLSHISHYLD